MKASRALSSALVPPSPQRWSGEDAFLSEIIDTQNDVAAVELDPPVIMRLVAERTQKLTGAEGASVQWIDGTDLVCRAVTGMMSDHLGYRFAMSNSLSGRALLEREALYCEDAETDPRVNREACRRSGTRSLICAPLFRGGDAIGVLNVVSLRPNAFEPRHVAGLKLMGGVVAAALHHAAEFEIKKHLLAERTRALAALRESEERFRNSFEHAAIGMALVGLDGRWHQVNRSLCDIVGYSEAELLVTTFQAITHPEDLNTDLDFTRKLVAGEVRNYHMTKRYFHKQGHVVWVLLSVSLVRDEAGRPLYFISQIEDISARKHGEDALRASEEAYRTTFEMAGVGMAHTSLTDGRFLRVNRELCEITGYSADELKCLTFYQITHPEDVEANRDGMRRVAAGETDDLAFEKRYVRKNGSVVWVALTVTLIRDLVGKPLHAVAMSNDITERKRAEFLERDRREVLQLVAEDRPLEEILDRITVLVQRQTGGGAVVMLVQGGEISLHSGGLPAELTDALRRTPLRLAAALSGACGEGDAVGRSDVATDPAWADARAVAAAHRFTTCLAVPLRGGDGTTLGLLCLLREETRGATEAEAQLLHTAGKLATIGIEHHQTASLLTHSVRHDPLTGLPNRVFFEDRLEQALAVAKRNGRTVGLFVMDLDRFKAINDTLGHQAGDALLQQFAHRVKALLRDTDTLARIGGDEFMLLLPDLAGPDGTAVVANTILKSLAEPFVLEGRETLVSGSIGIATCPRDGKDGESLQRAADAAMYEAKKNGRNGFAMAR